MKIPQQLMPYRFIKTHRKAAICKGWPIDPVRFTQQSDGSWIDNFTKQPYKSNNVIFKGKQESYTFNQMNEILRENELRNDPTHTYGVLCGFNGLVVVDLDNEKIANKLSSVWPFSDTFASQSAGKKLPHFYFKCEDYCRQVKYDLNKKRIIDVQARSSYVIGPNSTIKSNNVISSYDIISDNDIIEIKFEELLNIIEEHIGDSLKIQKKEKNIYTDDYFDLDPLSNEIFKKISCDEILSENDIDISNNPGNTPFADSSNQKCLHRSGHLWFDFHIQSGGTVIQLYAKINKIDTIQAKYDLAERAGVSERIFKEAMQYFIKNKQHEMTELMASRFLGTIRTYTIRSDKSKTPEIYIYKDGIYIPNGISYINEFCDNFLNKWYSTTLVKKIIDKIVVRTLIDADEFFKESSENLLPVQNGILDINTLKLYEFTSDMRFFNKLPIKYDPEKKCETTIKHFETVLNGKRDLLVMQELYGYLLYRNYKFEKALMFYGEGSNGKSKTMEQMRALLGEHNTINLSLQQLQNEKFSRCNLHRKLANLADDIGNAKLEETQIFKELTGGSAITADRKFMTSVTFQNYAKMIFSANKIPDVADDTDGFWRRWILIGFNKKFLNKLEYEKLEKEGNLMPYHCVKDIDIISKLTTEDELSGVLNWALIGYKRLKEQKGFSNTDSYNDVRNVWKRNVSSAIAFLQDQIIRTRNPEDYEVVDDVYSKYLQYCESNNLDAETSKMFGKFMTKENIIAQRKTVAHGKEWRYLRIRTR